MLFCWLPLNPPKPLLDPLKPVPALLLNPLLLPKELPLPKDVPEMGDGAAAWAAAIAGQTSAAMPANTGTSNNPFPSFVVLSMADPPSNSRLQIVDCRSTGRHSFNLQYHYLRRQNPLQWHSSRCGRFSWPSNIDSRSKSR